jgi:hypothetical protein
MKGMKRRDRTSIEESAEEQAQSDVFVCGFFCAASPLRNRKLGLKLICNQIGCRRVTGVTVAQNGEGRRGRKVTLCLSELYGMRRLKWETREGLTVDLRCEKDNETRVHATGKGRNKERVRCSVLQAQPKSDVDSNSCFSGK